MKKYIFIIPLTPLSYSNATRIELQNICFNTLVQQSYQCWTALLIGDSLAPIPNDERFVKIAYEGKKEEKLQVACNYIIDNIIDGDYLIRLDDDDVINPEILMIASKLNFDVYTDLYQSFIHFDSGKIAQCIWYWMPNTCIHKREWALTPWGEYAPREFKRFRDKPFLIERDHFTIHRFYKKRRIVYASKKQPIYLRVVSDITVTANNVANWNRDHFLNRFGFWRKNKLIDFGFIHFRENYQIKQSKILAIKLVVNNVIAYLKIKKDRYFN